jgi:hypothetical protein
MSKFTGSGSLPTHKYVWVKSQNIRTTEDSGYEPVVWFGISSNPSRAFGCHVRTDDGAVIRNLPPHYIAFSEAPDESWQLASAQQWDCTGLDFAVHEYTYLRNMKCGVYPFFLEGRYLFTLIPLQDGWTEEPEQAKEYMFVALNNGRLAIRPTNKIVFHDESRGPVTYGFQQQIKAQTQIWTCE